MSSTDAVPAQHDGQPERRGAEDDDALDALGDEIDSLTSLPAAAIGNPIKRAAAGGGGGHVGPAQPWAPQPWGLARLVDEHLVAIARCISLRDVCNMQLCSRRFARWVRGSPQLWRMLLQRRWPMHGRQVQRADWRAWYRQRHCSDAGWPTVAVGDYSFRSLEAHAAQVCCLAIGGDGRQTGGGGR